MSYEVSQINPTTAKAELCSNHYEPMELPGYL